MKKRRYKTKNVKHIDWSSVAGGVRDKDLVFAIDVAKNIQFATLMDKNNHVYINVKWKHSEQTSLLIEEIKKLPYSNLVIALEPTGTYGDTIIHLLRKAGYTIFQIAGKKVKDATELYDNVPSQHDAKSAYIIARLYWQGSGSEWKESTEQQRDCRAYTALYDDHKDQHQRIYNRLEGALQRHWPVLSQYLDVKSITFEQLLIKYGSPQNLALDAENARKFMVTISRSKLDTEKIKAVIEGSINSIGVPCIEGECYRMQQLGEELRYHRLAQKEVKKKLKVIIGNDIEIDEIVKVAGVITTAVLLGNHLDPRDYHCATAYLKAAGLNLKEKSSGKYQGQLKITKRGPSIARKYLYWAVNRLIKLNATVKRWHRNKLRQHGKGKNNKSGRWITALMRKLVKGLFHTRHGNPFDANKLLSLKDMETA